MKKILIVLVGLAAIFAFVSCAEGILIDQPFSVKGAREGVQFRIGDRYGIIFNDTDIVIEDDVVVDGVLSSNHVEYGIDGFAGQDDVKGYFLPLEIQNEDVDDSYVIEARLMGEEVPADILYSGGKYYAVIRLHEDGERFDFDHGRLGIVIENRFKRFVTSLELLQRNDSSASSPGLLLKPGIVVGV